MLLQIGALAIGNRLQAAAPPSEVNAEDQVLVEEFDPASIDMSGRNPAAHLPDGLHTIIRTDQAWRMLLRTRSDGSRIAVAQPTASRDEIARDSAPRTILPLLALIPCLMLLTGIVIRQTFRPVARLAAKLDAKTSDHLASLSPDGIPAELVPFIASINRLLERIRTVFEQQNRFIADAVHELRTPITALSLQAENLARTGLPAEGQERLATLRTGIQRTGRLLEQLLTLARYDAAGSTVAAPETRLDDVAKQTVADLLPLARARAIDLGFEHIEPVTVRVDVTMLAIVLRNLIDNALRHSNAGGRIDLSVTQDGERARFIVEDTGPGITQAELGRIFEPFYRGLQVHGDGSGLGLAIVRRILDRMAGSIILENVMESGQRAGLRAAVMIPRGCFQLALLASVDAFPRVDAVHWCRMLVGPKRSALART
ncbi:ATP-binding protein [Bosea sp. 2RAB26]|uniref:ATP-binding protein n=1 Tax=Bosea sp. 2RAB26 TaxID=3237476 RepID=UPI003F8F038E